MKRYSVLFLSAFFLIAIAVSCTAYISSAYTGKQDTTKTTGVIAVYTTLPVENVACLAEEYEKYAKIKVNFVPLTEKDLLNKLKEKPVGDAILADSNTLKKLAVGDDTPLLPYFSEANDSVNDSFKDEDGLWNGVWYDPIVMCVNKDFLVARGPSDVPMSWEYLSTHNDIRIGLTDPAASDAAANVLYFMAAQYGIDATLQIYNRIHPKVVQYSKYLSTPVRMAGMGEVDLSIAVQSEALRYINDGYPLRIVYPSEGTAYLLIGTGVIRTSANVDRAEAFVDWLLSDDAQIALQSHDFFFMTTGNANMSSKLFSEKNIVLFEKQPNFTAEQQQQILDDWIKLVRFKPVNNK